MGGVATEVVEVGLVIDGDWREPRSGEKREIRKSGQRRRSRGIRGCGESPRRRGRDRRGGDRFEHTASLADRLAEDELHEPPPLRSIVTKRPMGVAALIIPWNWPLSTLGAKLPQALLAGNTVVIKPLANDSSYGLCSSVCSADVERAISVARRLEAGYTYINHHGPFAQDNRVPFGGVKQSGLGRQLGIEGVLEFVGYHSISIYE